MAQLSERLRQLRKQRRMTQKDLEEISHVPQNTISRIEIGGAQEISTKTLISLAGAFKVSTDYLLGLSEDDHEITWSQAPAAEEQVPIPTAAPPATPRRKAAKPVRTTTGRVTRKPRVV
jgi:transcriptional regulator with XRE-family HTH domain